jgi:hypothetical protein
VAWTLRSPAQHLHREARMHATSALLQCSSRACWRQQQRWGRLGWCLQWPQHCSRATVTGWLI